MPQQPYYQTPDPTALISAMLDPENPTMSVPPFDGDPAKFEPFWQNFEASIEANRRIPPIQKFNILRENLTGRPKQTIDALSPTADNYEVAKKLLIATYCNKDYLSAQSHI